MNSVVKNVKRQMFEEIERYTGIESNKELEKRKKRLWQYRSKKGRRMEKAL